MASSTRIPSTTIKANRETKFIDAPINPMVANAPMKEIGKPIATQIAKDGRRTVIKTKQEVTLEAHFLPSFPTFLLNNKNCLSK